MHEPTLRQSKFKPKRAILGFTFSLVGSILILVQGLIRITAGDVITFAGSDEFRHRFLADLALNLIGGVAVAFAILVLVGHI